MRFAPSPLVTALMLFAAIGTSTAARTAVADETSLRGWSVVIHGGAGDWQDLTPEVQRDMRHTLLAALDAASDKLQAGGSSLDAVEVAIAVLEDAPHFNAGKGAVFNAAGGHQLDASIMNGSDRAAGGVAAVSTVKNPIRLARRVMTNTPHVLLVGAGADQFAAAVGAEQVTPDYFWTEALRKRWDAQKGAARQADHFGTVGCVALDREGNLAAGTSTGGLEGKKFGRVGDSPLIGAGTFADNSTCAISCTGVGELFIRGAIAYDVSARVKYTSATLPEAVDHHIHETLAAGTGGMIALSPTGEVVAAFNTRAMPRAIADSRGRREAIVVDPTASNSNDPSSPPAENP